MKTLLITLSLFASAPQPDFDVGPNCQEVHERALLAHQLPYTEVTLTEVLEQADGRDYLFQLLLEAYDRPRHVARASRVEAARRFAERKQIECIRNRWGKNHD
jgi:hypothetical protein